MDNPGDFSNKVGDDIYLNPWWALKFQDSVSAEFCAVMTEVLGPPDLWFQGLYHQLLWGRRDVSPFWRPSLCVNLSGGNGKLWFKLWLPWRGEYLRDGTVISASVLDFNVDLKRDLEGLYEFCQRSQMKLDEADFKKKRLKTEREESRWSRIAQKI